MHSATGVIRGMGEISCSATSGSPSTIACSAALSSAPVSTLPATDGGSATKPS